MSHPFDPSKHPRDPRGRFADEVSRGGEANTRPSAPRPEPADSKRRHAVQPVSHRKGIVIRGGVTQQTGD